jgi:uncharacterized coiled-coil protein SlyX
MLRREYSPHGRRLRAIVASVACPIGISAGFLALASSAEAQIRYIGSGTPIITAVCAFQNQLIIATGQDCEDPTDPSASPTSIEIGPEGAATVFQESDGSVQFNGASTSFANMSTFNGGISVTGGSVTMGGLRVQNVADPTADTDAANKRYVDQENADQDTRITNVENVNAAQQTQIDDIESVNADQQTQINTNTANIADLQSTSTDLQNQINANTADIFALQSDVADLRERDRELAEGIAISLALDAPILRNGQTFAMRGGWGNFDGSNAAGVTAAGALSQNVVVDAGVGWGTSQGTVAGKAGMTIGW